MTARHVVLGSASPRRADLLSAAGMTFDVQPADVDEPLDGGEPHALAVDLARRKFDAVNVLLESDAVLLTADTIVWHEEEGAMGKPADDEDAARMLRSLSGQWHRVVTGFVMGRRSRDSVHSESVDAKVRFRVLSETDIVRYVATGEPFGKAGAYAVQGQGAALVDRIEGSLSTVIGLPVTEVIACYDHNF